MRQVAPAARPPRSSKTPDSPAAIAPAHVVLQVVAHAEHPLGRQAQRSQAASIERRMRLAVADFRRDHQRVDPARRARAGPRRPPAAGRRIRGDAERTPRLAAGACRAGADVGEASPGLGPAEMVPELVERPLRVGHLGQDAGDDPPPAPALGRLVGRPAARAPRRPRRRGNGRWNRACTSSRSSSTPCRAPPRCRPRPPRDRVRLKSRRRRRRSLRCRPTAVRSIMAVAFPDRLTCLDAAILTSPRPSISICRRSDRQTNLGRSALHYGRSNSTREVPSRPAIRPRPTIGQPSPRPMNSPQPAPDRDSPSTQRTRPARPGARPPPPGPAGPSSGHSARPSRPARHVGSRRRRTPVDAPRIRDRRCPGSSRHRPSARPDQPGGDVDVEVGDLAGGELGKAMPAIAALSVQSDERRDEQLDALLVGHRADPLAEPAVGRHAAADAQPASARSARAPGGSWRPGRRRPPPGSSRPGRRPTSGGGWPRRGPGVLARRSA